MAAGIAFCGITKWADDSASIKAVLTGNARQVGAVFTTVVIDACINIDPAGVIA